MFWTRALELLLLPPSGLVVLGLAGLLLARGRRRRFGLGLTAACGLSLLLLSVPWIQGECLATLDRYPAVDPSRDRPGRDRPAGGDVGAVVILGAGIEHHDDIAVVSRPGLERLTAGAELHRRTGRPILVSGYSGELMARELERRSLAARWIESTSRNTHQNALQSAAMLRRDGVSRIYLVTHFWHMPRAVAAFRHVGLEVVPAPIGQAALVELRRGWRAWVPARTALAASKAVFHEWAGRAWYRLRYGY